MILFLDDDIKPFFSEKEDLFTQVMSLRGEKFRELENRCTQKITLGEKNYFIKQHFGIGWKEIFKNLFQLRLPVLSAKNEWLAIQRLNLLKIAVPIVKGYGSQGINPAKIKSFLLTEELPPHISLEFYCKEWRSDPPSFKKKIALIKKVARIARTLHENGVNHRDFYLCHFLLPLSLEIDKLCLIDLHRAQIRGHVPERWIVKDLAGLYFSSKEIGLTNRDLLRFVKEYRNKTLPDVFNKESAFWQKVKQRGDQLYRKHAN